MPARFGVGLACRLAVTSGGRKTTIFDLRRVVMDIMWPISQSHFHVSYLCLLK